MTGIPISDFIIVLMIFLRITAAFVAAPVFGNRAFPVLPKLFLAFIIALIIFNTIDHRSINVEPTLWWLAVNAIKEILSGLMLGFVLNMVFYGISYAGHLIGFDMGLMMAEAFNPMEEVNSNVIGDLITVAAILIFFLINGHHYLIRGLAYSFQVVPVGELTFSRPIYEIFIKYSASVFIIAVKIASPILVSFFLVYVAEGIIARVIPNMQVFFVTQPLKIGVGFTLLIAVTPVYVYVIKNLLKEYEDNLFQVIKAMGS
jgi:flagellar biosynthetic protein FliR